MILTSLLAALTLSLFSAIPLCDVPQAEGVNEETSFRALPKNAVFNMDDEELSYTETLHTDDYIEVYIPYGTYKRTNGTDFVLDSTYVSNLESLSFNCNNILFYPRSMDKTDMVTYMRGAYILPADISFINPDVCTFTFGQGESSTVRIEITYEDLFKWKDNPILSLVENSSNPSYIVYNVQVPLTPTDVVSEIVTILGSGIVSLGTALGGGVNAFVQALAFNALGDGLSIYFVLVVSIAGVALAIALTSRIFVWLSSLGR